MNSKDSRVASSLNEQSTETNMVGGDTFERREFLKKLGKYSAVTSTTTVTLMTANKVSALSPPPVPADQDQGTWPD